MVSIYRNRLAVMLDLLILKAENKGYMDSARTTSTTGAVNGMTFFLFRSACCYGTAAYSTMGPKREGEIFSSCVSHAALELHNNLIFR